MLGFTLLGSVGTAVATAGVPFLAQSAYGYRERAVFLLALLYGVAYIPGALGVGPALRRMAERHAWLTSARVLAGISLVLGVLAALPWLTRPDGHEGAAGAWAIWVMMAAQGLLSGATWPIVESYLSGGRRGQSLRHATGLFNITWGGCVVLSLAALGPFVEHHPLPALAAMLPVYIGCALLTRWMGPEPAVSLPDAHPSRPAQYKRLLRVFRVQLPTSFLVVAVLEPASPFLIASVAIEDPWRTPAASIWLATRLAAFVLLARWHGWHGRWWMPTVAALVLLAGFAAITLAPNLMPTPAPPGAAAAPSEPLPLQSHPASAVSAGVQAGPAAPPGSLALAQGLVLLGLAVLGWGAGMIYTGALYYAMEVGDARIDAGGTHEALIGLGYLGGPAVGLAAYALTQPHGSLPISPTLMLLALTGGLVLLLGVGSVAWAVASCRSEPGQAGPGKAV
ncbi:MAG: hypothetical protein KatS3mg103_0093 [Phycisphaerales bacterium]|nr:MAG: hypothetical protein KatS3mg103_0093 [Phycisphaerales bacterium]